MARWEPGARTRLQAVALELFAARGFDDTTVTEIAQAAGLTERTFFRHFADKREVLFTSREPFEQPYLAGVAAAPPEASPLDTIATAILNAADFFALERRPYSRQRQTIIDAHPELQERELLKLASLANSLAAALRERGITEPTATLAAESGVTVFRVSFAQWIAAGEERSLDQIERETFRGLGMLTTSANASRIDVTVTP